MSSKNSLFDDQMFGTQFVTRKIKRGYCDVVIKTPGQDVSKLKKIKRYNLY